jgi:hypothetical protein
MRRGNGGIRREQSEPTQPGFQQRRPQIERGVSESESAAVFSFRKDVHLRQDSGCAQGSVKCYAGVHRRQFIVCCVVEEGRRRLRADPAVRRVLFE